MSNDQLWAGEENLDWDKVSDEPLPPPEDGIYEATIVEVKFQLTKAGKPSQSLKLKLVRDLAGNDAGGRTLFDNPVFSIESAFRVKQLSKAADVAPPSRVTRETIDAFGAELVGRNVFLRTKQSTYQGRTNAKVDRYFTAEQAHEAAKGGSSASEEASTSRRRRAS